MDVACDGRDAYDDGDDDGGGSGSGDGGGDGGGGGGGDCDNDGFDNYGDDGCMMLMETFSFLQTDTQFTLS